MDPRPVGCPTLPEMRDACVQTCGFSPCFLEGTPQFAFLAVYGLLCPIQHVPPDVPPDLGVFLLNYQQAPRAKSQKKNCNRPTTCGFISEMRTCPHVQNCCLVDTCRQKKNASPHARISHFGLCWDTLVRWRIGGPGKAGPLAVWGAIYIMYGMYLSVT